jgi:RHS repeat-associated protein
LGRRILKEDHTGASVVTWLYTYDGQKVVGEYDDSGASPVLARYYVDGAGYIDEHVLVNQQTGAQAGEYYYLLKELYSVAGLANANGEIVEAYDYDAYGKVRIFTTGLDICDGFGDFDGDCDVDIADFEALQLCYAAGGLPGDCPNSAAALARLDSDSDGDVDDTDLIAFVAAYTGPQGGLFADGDWNSNGALGPVDYNNFVNLCYSGPGGGFNTNGCQVYDFDGDGDVDLDDFGVLWDLLYDDAPSVEITLTAAERSAVNDYFFTGRRLDLVPHGGENHQRYYYRARTYNTERFMQRDPIETAGQLTFAQFVSSRPTIFTDPLGLAQCAIRQGDPVCGSPDWPPLVRQRYLGSSFEWGGADGCPGVTVRRPFDEC